jgi:hypothetical protein
MPRKSNRSVKRKSGSRKTKVVRPSRRRKNRVNMQGRSKTTKRSSRSRRGVSSREVSQSATKMIDEIANLLKRGVLFGSEKTAETQEVFERKAKAFVEEASDRLMDAANEGIRATGQKVNRM